MVLLGLRLAREPLLRYVHLREGTRETEGILVWHFENFDVFCAVSQGVLGFIEAIYFHVKPLYVIMHLIRIQGYWALQVELFAAAKDH